MPRKIRPYEQHALDSCLTCCLLLLSKYYGKRPKLSKQLELKLLRAGLMFDSKNYDIGQLHEIARRYRIAFDYLVEDLETFHYTRRLPFSKRIVIHNKKIDMNLIKEKIKKGPVIISMDPFDILDESHYSHYILLKEKKGRFYSVIDPWTGEEKLLESKTLSKSVNMLRRQNYSPVLISKRNGKL